LLKAVVSQHLCRRAGGEGRIAAVEVLLQTYAISHMIRESKTHQIDGYLESIDARSGMQSLDTALLGFMRDGLIDAAEAFPPARFPEVFRRQVSELSEEL